MYFALISFLKLQVCPKYALSFLPTCLFLHPFVFCAFFLPTWGGGEQGSKRWQACPWAGWPAADPLRFLEWASLIITAPPSGLMAKIQWAPMKPLIGALQMLPASLCPEVYRCGSFQQNWGTGPGWAVRKWCDVAHRECFLPDSELCSKRFCKVPAVFSQCSSSLIYWLVIWRTFVWLMSNFAPQFEYSDILLSSVN